MSELRVIIGEIKSRATVSEKVIHQLLVILSKEERMVKTSSRQLANKIGLKKTNAIVAAITVLGRHGLVVTERCAGYKKRTYDVLVKKDKIEELLGIKTPLEKKTEEVLEKKNEFVVKSGHGHAFEIPKADLLLEDKGDLKVDKAFETIRAYIKTAKITHEKDMKSILDAQKTLATVNDDMAKEISELTKLKGTMSELFNSPIGDIMYNMIKLSVIENKDIILKELDAL